MNVLILEADPLANSLLLATFLQWGHRIYSYSNPLKCPAFCSQACPCDLSRTGCPEVVLVDMHMPGVSGLKFIEELRRKNCHFCKIGMMADNWSSSDLQKALHLGASVFAKPFHFPSLHSWISAEIKRVA